MNGFRGLVDGPVSGYVRVLLAVRLGELRRRLGQRELGASAIELAIITAIIGLVAVGLALLIQSVVSRKKSIIGGL
jgi:Flp pilus assembly pilin Flp